MTRRGGAARRLAALALGLGAAGCGSDIGDAPGRARADLLALGAGALGLGAPPPEPPSRARLEAIGGAVIWVQLEGAPAGGALVALVENSGRVVYVSGDRRSLTFEGAQIVAANAVGAELAGYRSDPEADPTRRPRPLAEWPEEVVRVWRFRDAMGRPFARAAVCTPRAGAPEAVEVYGLTLTLTPVTEPCRTPAHAFTNRWWLEAETGRVWKSEQWLGPEAGMITIEVVRPFG